MNAYTKGQNAAITYLNENPTTSKVAFLNASQAQAASLYKSQASITQFIRGFLSLESEYHFATVPASTEPVIVETLTADDGETVETGYIYQEEEVPEGFSLCAKPELQSGDIISVQHRCDAEATIGTVEAVSHDAEYVAVNCRYAVLFRKNARYAQAYWVSIGGTTKVELVERPTPPQPTPLQRNFMSFFTSVAMWAVYQEVNAWDVAPEDDTDWLHAFQAADEWIAEHGHPEGCVCGFCKEVAQESYIVSTVLPIQMGVQFWTLTAGSAQEAIDKVAADFWEPLREQCKAELKACSVEEMEALQAAWDALQAVPAYVERDAHAKGLYARLKAGETIEVAPIANPDNQFSIRPDKWEGLVIGYTVLVDGEPVPGNVGMMLDSETVKDWLSGLVERRSNLHVLRI